MKKYIPLLFILGMGSSLSCTAASALGGVTQAAKNVFIGQCATRVQSRLESSPVKPTEAQVRSICECALEKVPQLVTNPSSLDTQEVTTIVTECTNRALGTSGTPGTTTGN